MLFWQGNPLDTAPVMWETDPWQTEEAKRRQGRLIRWPTQFASWNPPSGVGSGSQQPFMISASRVATTATAVAVASTVGMAGSCVGIGGIRVKIARRTLQTGRMDDSDPPRPALSPSGDPSASAGAMVGVTASADGDLS